MRLDKQAEDWPELNNFSGFWGAGAASYCLVPGPGVIREGKDEA